MSKLMYCAWHSRHLWYIYIRSDKISLQFGKVTSGNHSKFLRFGIPIKINIIHYFLFFRLFYHLFIFLNALPTHDNISILYCFSDVTKSEPEDTTLLRNSSSSSSLSYEIVQSWHPITVRLIIQPSLTFIMVESMQIFFMLTPSVLLTYFSLKEFFV